MRWLARWIDPDGWIREHVFDTKHDAERFLKGKNKPLGVVQHYYL